MEVGTIEKLRICSCGASKLIFLPSQLSVGPRLGSIRIPKKSFFQIQIPTDPNPDLATICESGKFEFRKTVIKFNTCVALFPTPFAEVRIIICGVTFL
jgi:hypothetical protein